MAAPSALPLLLPLLLLLLLLLCCCSSTATSAAHHRLPKTVTPFKYDLHLAVDLEDCTFLGKIVISLKVHNVTNRLEFHSGVKIDKTSILLDRTLDPNLLNFHDVEQEDYISKSNKNKTKLTLLHKGKRKDIAQIKLGDNLLENGNYQLYMKFNGTMYSKKTYGMYCWSYKVDGKVKRLVSTFFEPDLARRAFPCWDEPSFKSAFSIRISHINTTTAISNMHSYQTLPLKSKPGWVTDWFSQTPLMPTYLASWLVSEYEVTTTVASDGSQIRAWNSPGKKTGYLLEYALTGLARLENILSFKDPIEKHDLVLINNLRSSGLENWGIISFRESRVATENATKPWLMKAANLVVHELAHSWFGNLVTPLWWDDIWLSEGIVTYLAERTVQDLHPEWDFLRNRLIEQLVKVFFADSLPSTNPLVFQTVPETFKQAFNTITYHKGALIMWMVENMVGRDVMQSGLAAYVKGRAFSSADEGFLWQSIGSRASPAALPKGFTLGAVMENWTRKPGHPIVTVIRNYTDGTVTITQRSVLKDGTKWWIPLSYIKQGSQLTYRTWLYPSEDSLVLTDPATPEQWLLFNINASGLYRVEYDKRNRQLLDKSWSEGGGLEEVVSVRGGVAPGPGHPAAWPAALRGLSRALALTRGTPHHRLVKERVKGVIEEEFMKQGGLWGNGVGSHYRKALAALACSLPLEPCLIHAKTLYHFWISEDNHPPTDLKQASHFQLEEDVRQTVLCMVVKEMGEVAWVYVRQRLLKEPPEHQRAREDMIRALACSQNKDILATYVNWALTNGKSGSSLDRNEARLAIKAVAENHPGITLDLLSSNATTKSNMKKIRWDRVLETLAQQVNSEQQLRKLVQIAEKKGVDSKGLVQIADNNFQWFQNNLEELSSWLEEIKEDKQPH